MKSFMVDSRDLGIERDKFEIVQRDRPFWRLQPLRVGTLDVFEKIRGDLNLPLDVPRVGKIVGRDNPGKMQKKLATESQWIYCTRTRMKKYAILIGAHDRYQIIDTRPSLRFGKLFKDRRETRNGT